MCHFMWHYQAQLLTGKLKREKIFQLKKGIQKNCPILRVLDENNEIRKILIYPKKSKAMNFAFDVTPAKYVTGLITEKGISEASTEGLKKVI